MNRRLWQLICLLGIFVVQGYAQLNRGYISGTVQDATGAVIVNATVKITNTATNVQRSTVTNDVGFYRFPAVEPGTYTVAFSNTGFETRKVENVNVVTTQEAVVNQTLSVASSANVLEVVESSVGVQLSKASPTVERTLSHQTIVNLPMPTTGGVRDVTQLALLAPTATRAPGSTGISANGQRARNNNFLVDGVDNNDPSVTIANARLTPEGLQEFQVQTSSYSAEYGRNSGAQILAITRSGSNAFHAEAYDYYQGNWLNPVTLPNKRNNVFHTPRFNQNQAGGDLGGPIVRNKTFFFALIETSRRREAPSSSNATSSVIPTPQGFADLANVPLAPGSGGTPEETPDARARALNGIAFLKSIYAQNPGFTNLRTTTINGVPIQIGSVTIPIANPFDFWYGQARVDHTFSARDTLSYRYLGDHRTQPDYVSNLGFGSLFSGAQAIFRQNHSLTETHTFGPRVVNEFRAAYIRSLLDFPENDPTDPSSGISGAFTIGGLSNYPQGRVGNTFQYQDVLTMLFGRHSIKVGADIRRQRLYNVAAFDSKGTYTFDNFADFINNRPASLAQALNTATFDARQWQTFYFVQDDIRATKDLTINIGLRYEYTTTPFGFFGATDPAIQATRVPGPTKDDTNNWAPRFGIAYSPSGTDGVLGSLFGGGKTVFRGGYGIGYDVLFYNILTVNGSNYPRVIVSNQTNRNVLANQWPRLLSGNPTTFDPLATFVNSPSDLQAPTTHFYSASIQRQFGNNIVEVGYSGSRSYHGIRQGQLNPGTLTQAQVNAVLASGNAASAGSLQSRRLFPAYGSRVTIESTAIGNYNGLYVKYDRRYARGLTVGANYTYSANMSDNDESLGVSSITNSSPQIPQNFFDYRSEYSRSAFDRPHRFSGYFNYEVPWFSNGGLSSAVPKLLFRGWSLNGIIDDQSGQPFTIRTGVDTYGNGSTAARPNYNPGGIISKDTVTGNFRTFTIPLNGTGIVFTPLNAAGVPLANSSLCCGNLGRNTFRGPRFDNVNFGLMKNTNITERFRTQIRADFINLFNHRNFGNPVSTMNSPAFGTNTSDPGGRSITLGAKVIF